MKRTQAKGWLPPRLVAAATAAALAIGLAGTARAADDADAIVKAMSDYVSSQKTISLTFDSSIEIVTPQIQKIQFASSGSLDLSRPGQFRAHRVGGYADVEAVSDGKLLTILGHNLNVFAQVPVEGGTLDDIVAGLRDRGADMPGADLFSSNPYEALMQDVIDAKHIGRGVVDGVECEHLAFRTLDTDWQLWVEVGDKPIPRKFVITSKAVAAAPEYTLVIRDWKTDPAFAADAFAFKPPSGAKKVEFTALGDIDEIPAGAPIGGK